MEIRTIWGDYHTHTFYSGRNGHAKSRPQDIYAVAKEKGLKQVADTGELEKIVDEVIANNSKQVEQYKAGNERLFGFFVGQTMKATGGKANPQIINEILKKKLGS